MRRGEEADLGEAASWIVLRHHPAEGLGLIGNALRDVGVQHRVLDTPRGEALPRDIRDVGGIIVLGGPMSANDSDQLPWLRKELELLDRALTAGRPVLGICLGAQMIARALGGKVFPGEKREVGWSPVTFTPEGKDDPLLLGVPDQLTVFHMHGDTYELPPDGTNLATTPLFEQQAFSWGETVYGFQFHLEFTDAIIARLTTEPESQQYIREAGADPQEVNAESPGHVKALTDVAQDIFTRYFRQCGL
jgi:GMP synthase (glutamine-hydrolysing)